jgi:hypothetical protein
MSPDPVPPSCGFARAETLTLGRSRWVRGHDTCFVARVQMSTNVHIIQPSDFLRATPEGHADLAAAERLLYDIAEKARDIEDFNVLIDLRTVSGGLLTAGELWHLAEQFAQHRHIGRRKTAILSPRDRFDNARFFALCAAVQENGPSVVPFRSYEDAMEWLLGSPSSVR